MLSDVNIHPRDSNIEFTEENHEYNIKDSMKNPISVTTLIHEYFPKFDADKIINKMVSSSSWRQSKYYGFTKQQIKDQWKKSGEEAATNGTIMHKNIEDYINGYSNSQIDNKDFIMFKNFWRDLFKKYPIMKPYRTEWVIYDEDSNIAGSIDCVTSINDKLIILDWKRSKKITMNNIYEKGRYPFDKFDNCNFSHYSLQLNFYRHILENKYNKEVIFMMLVILHPDQENYMCYSVDRIDLTEIWDKLRT